MNKRKERKRKEERERLENIFAEDHSGTVAGRKLDELLRKAGLKK